MVFETKSSFAIPLFSCKVTQAVFESSETVMYSGSISFAKSLPGPKILNPFALNSMTLEAKEAKFTVPALDLIK